MSRRTTKLLPLLPATTLLWPKLSSANVSAVESVASIGNISRSLLRIAIANPTSSQLNFQRVYYVSLIRDLDDDWINVSIADDADTMQFSIIIVPISF